MVDVSVVIRSYEVLILGYCRLLCHEDLVFDFTL